MSTATTTVPFRCVNGGCPSYVPERRQGARWEAPAFRSYGRMFLVNDEHDRCPECEQKGQER